jgi:lysophospholipase
MDWLRKPGRVETITTPLLIVGAGKDRICQTPQIRAFAQRLPHGDYVEIKQAEHEILMERNAIRAEFWAAFDAFITKHHASA